MSISAFPSWINGDIGDRIAVTDRGLAYGDGVFETLRLQPRPVLMDFHRQRLAESLKLLGIPCDLERLFQDVARYIEDFSPGIIKIIVTRGSGGRGYAPPPDPETTTVLQGFPLPDYPRSWYEQGVPLYLCETPLCVNPRFAGIKHLNRLEQVMARREFVNTSCPEGLMANGSGWIEGTMSNLFLVNEETLLLPALAATAVKGTMQRFIMETCQELQCAVKELGAVNREQLLAADRVFVCNSVFGLWPVNAIGDTPVVPRSSVLFDQLQNRVMSLVS